MDNNNQLFNKLIYPYERYYDETYKRYYYYNTEKKESLWELPEDILEKIKIFREQYDIEKQNQSSKSNTQQQNDEQSQQQERQDEYQQEEDEDEQEQKNLAQFLSPEIIQKLQKKQVRSLQLMEKPARKQLEQSLADKYAYKEGDQEYNIWYGRHLSDTKNLVRDHKQPAETRCDSELDTGYTRADLSDKYSAYFCYHWAKGCCCEGVKCRFFHRVPSMAECMTVDNSRDIFGRARHSQHREDRGGIGSFTQETRSLEINDFKCPPEGKQGIVAQMYEILYRHFSEWGDIDDIKYVHGQNKALIRFEHRCMAEFAKEAMQHQALDNGEVINIKWFLESKDDESKLKYEREQTNMVKKAVEKKNQENQMKQRMKQIQENRKNNQEFVSYEDGNKEYDDPVAQQLAQQNEVFQRIQRMNQILDNIEDTNSGKNNQGNNQQFYIRPEINEMPLCFKKKK